MNLIKRVTALGMLTGWAWSGAQGDLLITEFMADNARTLADGDGHYSDWIEIHNPTAVDVNLAGWSLRDGRNLWTFPEHLLRAGGYLVVFASGQTTSPWVDPQGALHASFQLDSNGEPLALLNLTGEVVSEYPAPVPRQREDISYGLLTEQVTVVNYDSAARLWVPANPVDVAWRTGTPFDDAGWQPGQAAVGFNLNPGPVLGASGGIIAYQVVAGTSGNQDYGGALGMDFVVKESVQVTALGVFDDGANGLKTTLAAQLWRRNDRGTPGNFADDTGASILATLSFTPANPGLLEGGSRIKSLPNPLTLSPGSYTIVAYGYTAAERNGNIGSGGNPEAWSTDAGNGALEFVGGSRYGSPGPFPLTVDGGPSDRYAAGTFRFVRATDSRLRTDLAKEMSGRNSTVLVRIPFTVSGADKYTSGLLRVGYDDGFVAWLNGTEIARRNAPDPLDYEAHATAPGNAVETIFCGLPAGLLREGANLLALQGLNLSSTDRDFILAPEFVLVRVEAKAAGFFRHPTPGGPNDASSVSGFVAEPRVSVPRGFYDLPFQVELSCDTPGAEIRYTLDGSTPGLHQGIVYQTPVPIPTTTVLRAVASRAGLEASAVETHTYLFLNDVAVQGNTPAGFPRAWAGVTADYGMVTNTAQYARAAGNPAFTPAQARNAIAASLRALPALCLNADLGHWFDPATGLYVNPGARGEAWERPASTELLWPDGSTGFQVNAGVQVMGYTSRNLSATPKLSLRLLFERRFGPAWLHYSFFGEQAAPRFNSIALRANSRDTWVAEYAGTGSALYLADQWAKEAALDLGQPAPHGRFVHLYINGLYWGIYNPTERPDAAFAASYLGGERQDYDIIKFCCPDLLEDGDMTDWDALLAACSAGLADAAAYQRIQGNNPDGRRNPALKRLVDVDNLIDFILVGQYHASVDWPGNYYVGRNDRDDFSEGFKFFPWDNDLAFSGANVNANKVQTDPGSAWWITSPGALDIALRKNADYRLRFADHVYRHYFHTGALTAPACTTRWQRIAAGLEPALYAESARWGDYRGTLRTVQDHWRVMHQKMLQQYFPARGKIVLNQLKTYGLYPRFDAPEFSQEGGVVPSGFVLHWTATVPIYYTLDDSDPRLPGGAINPLARQAPGTGGPGVSLDHSATLKARAYDGNTWSALHEARFTVGLIPRPGSLAITELNYHPANPSAEERAAGFTDSAEFEFLELFNVSTNTLVLEGLQFTSGIALDETSPGAALLAPGECALVVANPQAFLARYGSRQTNRIAASFAKDARLANEGERITLRNPQQEVLCDFRYEDAAPWPVTADGAGATLVLIDRANPSLASSWRPSLLLGGTPGENLGLHEEWLRLHFSPPERADPELIGDYADPDGDGLVNLAEFSAGLDPRQANPQAALLAAKLENLSPNDQSAVYLTLTFRRPVDAEIQVILETSNDLVAWRPGLGELSAGVTALDDNGCWQTLTYRSRAPIDQAINSRSFWRLSLGYPGR